MLSSAFGGISDFDYSKTKEVREKILESSDQKDRAVPLGNDLDQIDPSEPGFQV